MAPAIYSPTSYEALEGWLRAADQAGVSLRGLIEALGCCLLEDDGDTLEALEALGVIRIARRVDAQRRNRKPCP